MMGLMEFAIMLQLSDDMNNSVTKRSDPVRSIAPLSAKLIKEGHILFLMALLSDM